MGSGEDSRGASAAGQNDAAARGTSGVRSTDDASHGAVAEIAPGVLRVLVPAPFPPGSVAATILEDKIDGRDVWTIVDTGLKSAESLWRELLDGPLSSRPVGRVIATHHHPDHIGLAGWFQSQQGAELWTTRTAWLYARMLQLDAPEKRGEPPYPEIPAFFRRCGYDEEQLERQALRSKFNFSVLVAPMAPGFRRIVAGETIEIGARRWEVLIGHGHAPEHAMLLSRDDGLLIAGDQILPRISPNIGVYPVEPESDPVGEWLESSRLLGAALNDDLLVLPGHGAPFYGAATRLAEIVAEHEEALDRLEASLAEPRRVIDCFEPMYQKRISAAAEGLATVETLAHLNHLRAADRAERRLGEDGVYWWRRKA